MKSSALRTKSKIWRLLGAKFLLVNLFISGSLCRPTLAAGENPEAERDRHTCVLSPAMKTQLSPKRGIWLLSFNVWSSGRLAWLPLITSEVPCVLSKHCVLNVCKSSFHSSPENRKDFLKAVHSILRDKHRRQLLKTESLPSSQQYVPFGGKRLCALKGARPAMSRAGTVGIQTFKIPVTPSPL